MVARTSITRWRLNLALSNPAADHIREFSETAEHHQEADWSLIDAKGHTRMYQDLSVTEKKVHLFKKKKKA